MQRPRSENDGSSINEAAFGTANELIHGAFRNLVQAASVLESLGTGRYERIGWFLSGAVKGVNLTLAQLTFDSLREIQETLRSRSENDEPDSN